VIRSHCDVAFPRALDGRSVTRCRSRINPYPDAKPFLPSTTNRHTSTPPGPRRNFVVVVAFNQRHCLRMHSGPRIMNRRESSVKGFVEGARLCASDIGVVQLVEGVLRIEIVSPLVIPLNGDSLCRLAQQGRAREKESPTGRDSE
jgi:hypothetical protein